MKHTFLIILALASICLLSACGGNDSDHGHPHDDDTHSHDGPETEAFYGDDTTNPSEDAVVDDNGHGHGDDTHKHDGDEEGPDSTTEHGEDEASVEPHGHDH